jgi:hypothetical protein
MIPFSIFIAFLLVYLIFKNKKDKANYVKFLNNDFPKKIDEDEVEKK